MKNKNSLSKATSEADQLKLIHELKFYQIELELIYEEKAKRAAELIIANKEIDFQAAAIKANALLEKLIDHANTAILIWDGQLHITRFNHAFEILTGRTEAEVLGTYNEVLKHYHQTEQNTTTLLCC